MKNKDKYEELPIEELDGVEVNFREKFLELSKYKKTSKNSPQ